MGMILRVQSIWLHCSATPWGDALIFDQWHRARGWSGIGYHFVILNGRPSSAVEYWPFLDGQIQPGRPLDDDPVFEAHEVGAHVAGRNGEGLAICMVGDQVFMDAQLVAAKGLAICLCAHFGLTTEMVFGHYEDPNTSKTCPNIPMGMFRAYLRNEITIKMLQDEIRQHNRRG